MCCNLLFGLSRKNGIVYKIPSIIFKQIIIFLVLSFFIKSKKPFRCISLKSDQKIANTKDATLLLKQNCSTLLTEEFVRKLRKKLHSGSWWHCPHLSFNLDCKWTVSVQLLHVQSPNQNMISLENELLNFQTVPFRHIPAHPIAPKYWLIMFQKENRKGYGHLSQNKRYLYSLCRVSCSHTAWVWLFTQIIIKYIVFLIIY